MRSIRSFKKMLGRFLAGSSTPLENRAIEKWYTSLDAQNNFPELANEEAEFLHTSDFEKIQKKIRRKERSSKILWPSIGVAAALVLFGIVYINYINSSWYRNSNIIEQEGRIVMGSEGKYYNNTSTTKEIWLIDSSKIALHPKSSISVSGSFNEKDRRVELEGEAFFQIKRNEHKPFLVFSFGVVTKVLGTSFVIKAPSKHQKVIVVVKTGKVSVSTNEKEKSYKVRNELVLTPNQQAAFDPDQKLLKASIIEKPEALIPAKVRIEYDEEPVSNILNDLENLYGVEIQFDAEALKNCRITTAFTKEGLYQRLEILSRAVGAKYSINGLQVSFTDSKCQIN
jgi:transmembrane sensor